MWDKLVHNLIKERFANMTSADWATQLVNKCEVKRREGRPTTN